jgi:hypothetical protein
MQEIKKGQEVSWYAGIHLEKGEVVWVGKANVDVRVFRTSQIKRISRTIIRMEG